LANGGRQLAIKWLKYQMVFNALSQRATRSLYGLAHAGTHFVAYALIFHRYHPHRTKRNILNQDKPIDCKNSTTAYQGVAQIMHKKDTPRNHSQSLSCAARTPFWCMSYSIDGKVMHRIQPTLHERAKANLRIFFRYFYETNLIDTHKILFLIKNLN